MADSGTKLAVKTESLAERASPSTEWRPMETLRRDIDHFIDDLGKSLRRVAFGLSGGDGALLLGNGSLWPMTPAADIVSKPDRYEITSDVPGMDEKNIEVKVSDGMLTIRGEKKHETEEKHEGYYLSERRFGAFQRSFPVPSGADSDKIEATLKNGVLTIIVPKAAEAKAEKTIAVQAA